MVKSLLSKIALSFFFVIHVAFAQEVCKQYDFDKKEYRQRVSELQHLPSQSLINYLTSSEGKYEEQLFTEIVQALAVDIPECISSEIVDRNYFSDIDIYKVLTSKVFERSKYSGPTLIRQGLVDELIRRFEQRDNLDLAQTYQHYKKSLLWIVKGRDDVSKGSFLNKVQTGRYSDIRASKRLTTEVYESFERSKKKLLRHIKIDFMKHYEVAEQTSRYFNREEELTKILNQYPLYKYYQDDFSYEDFVSSLVYESSVELYIEKALEKLNEKVSLYALSIYKEHSSRKRSLKILNSLEEKGALLKDEVSGLVNALEKKTKELTTIYQKYHSESAVRMLVQSRMIYNEMHRDLGAGRTLVANSNLNEIKDIYNNNYLPAKKYIEDFNRAKQRFNQLVAEIKPIQEKFLKSHALYVHKKTTLLSTEIKLEIKNASVLDDLMNEIALDYKRSFAFLPEINLPSFSSFDSKVQAVFSLEAQLVSKVGKKSIGVFSDQLNKIDQYSNILTKRGGRVPTGAFDFVGDFLGCLFEGEIGLDCDGNIIDAFAHAFKETANIAKGAIKNVGKISSNIVGAVGDLGHDALESFGKIVEVTKIDHVINDIADGVENIGNEVVDAIDHNITELIEEGEDFATDFVNNPVETLVQAAINGTIAPIVAPILIVSDPDEFLRKPGDVIDDFRSRSGEKIEAELERTFENVGDALEDVRDISEDALEHAWKDAVHLSTEAWDFSGELIDETKELAAKGVDIAQDVAFFAAKPLRQLDKDTYDKLKNRLDGWTDHAVASIFDAANPTRALKVDTYRKIYNGHKKAVMETVRDISKLNSKLTRKLNEEVLAKISKDLAKELERVVSLSEDGVDIVDATTSFENVARTAMMYVGSTIGGPAGAALANMLADRFILKKKMSEGDLLKSFAIGMTAGYAGEFAAGFADSGSILSASYSNAANQVSQDIGGVVVNGNSYSSDEFAKTLVQGVTSGVIGTQNFGGGAIGNASLTSMNNYVVNQLIEGESIDVNEAMRTAMEGGSQAALDEGVEVAFSRADLPQRLDKELYDAVMEKLEKFGEDENIMTEEMMLLQQKEFEETLKKLFELIEKNNLEQNRGPAFVVVGTAFALTQMGLAVYELYSFYDKASNDPNILAFIEEAKGTSVRQAMENSDFKKIVENYYSEIIGASIAAFGGVGLKALSKIKDLKIVNKVVERIIVYGKRGIDSTFITKIGDLVLKYKIDTVEQVELVFDMATEFVKKQGGKLEDVDRIFDSAGKLGFKTSEGVKGFADLSRRILGNDIGAVGDIAKAIRKSYVREVDNLSKIANKLGKAGKSQRQIAEEVLSQRNQLKVKYRNISPSNSKKLMEERNLRKYGNKVGPDVDYFLNKGISLDEIIEKASRAGGQDMGL